MSSMMQPRFGEDAYPIGRLVLACARALGLSRTDLVRRLRFANLHAGHASLTALMMTGSAPPTIAAKLDEVLEVEPDLINAVLVATARQVRDEAGSQMLMREDAYRAAFRPHLQVETERRIPSPIFVAALFGTKRLRVVPIPDAAFVASEEIRDQSVKTTIVEHYRDQRGHVPAFGAITTYALVLLAGYGGVDFGLPFDVSGDQIGPMREVRRLSEATLGTKRGDTRLTGLLKDTPIEAISTRRPTGCTQ